MDNLAPPPPYRSQNNTPQISRIKNRLQTLLNARVPFKNNSAFGPKLRVPLQYGDSGMIANSYINEDKKYQISTIDVEGDGKRDKVNKYEIENSIRWEYFTRQNSTVPYLINTIHSPTLYNPLQNPEGYMPKRASLKVGLMRVQ